MDPFLFLTFPVLLPVATLVAGCVWFGVRILLTRPGSKPDKPPPVPLPRTVCRFSIWFLWFLAWGLGGVTLLILVAAFPLTMHPGELALLVSGGVLFGLAVTGFGLIWQILRLNCHLWLLLFGRKQWFVAELTGALSWIPAANIAVQLAQAIRMVSRADSRRLHVSGIVAILLTVFPLPLLLWLPLPWVSGTAFVVAAWLAATGIIVAGACRLEPESLAPLSSHWRRNWIAATAFPLLILSTAAVLWIGFAVHVRCRVAVAETALTGLGVPPTPEAMRRLRPEPADNAYPFYQTLAARWQQEQEADPEDGGGFQVRPEYYYLPSLSAGVEQAARRELAKHSGTIALLKELPSHPVIRFPDNWEMRGLEPIERYENMHPEIKLLRHLGQIQQIRLLLAYQAKDYEAIPSLWRELEVLRDWLHGDEELPILTGMAITQMQWQTFEPILNRWRFSNGMLKEQISVTRSEEQLLTQDWNHLWIFYAFMLYGDGFAAPTLRLIFPPDRQPSTREQIQWESFPLNELVLLNQAAVLEELADLIRIDNCEFYQDQPILEKRIASSPFLGPAGLIIPTRSWSSLRFSAQLARERVFRTALAAELYRRKTGHWPEQLTDLVPEFLDAVPRDPFNGEPLKMRVGPVDDFVAIPPPKPEPEPEEQFTPDEVMAIPNIPHTASIGGMGGMGGMGFGEGPLSFDRVTRPGFTVYSVGPNEDDDGGTSENPNETGNRTGDITFTWYDQTQEESL